MLRRARGLVQLKRPPGEEGEDQEEEERCVSIVANLFLGLQRGSRRDRVAAKFVENEFEKCDRLAEVYLRLVAQVRAEEVRNSWVCSCACCEVLFRCSRCT